MQNHIPQLAEKILRPSGRIGSIKIGDHELQSAIYKDNYGYRCRGCTSNYYIKFRYSNVHILYYLYINLKKTNRLLDSDNVNHFMVEDD